MRKILRVAVTILLMLGFSQPLYAQRFGWTYLGEANVDGNADHDRIRVGRNDGRFRTLQIRVERAAIKFNRVVVHYGNGGDEEVEVRDRIPAGGRTRIINLRGRDRVIESVEFWYEKANYGSQRPKLRLYGR